MYYVQITIKNLEITAKIYSFAKISEWKITFAKDAFNQFGRISLLPGREITHSLLMSAYVLTVCSIITIYEELLKNSLTKLRFNFT